MTLFTSLLALAALGQTPMDTDAPVVVAPEEEPTPEHQPSWSGTIPPTLQEAAIGASTLSLAQRMRAVSEPLLGLPYLADPLGEGTGLDTDPPARYDAFDCLTFVEEVLGLAMAGHPAHAGAVRTALRYEGEAAYHTRRHFMELQWIPAAVAGGWLVDTTRTYGTTTRFEREVTTGLWKAWGRRSLFKLTDEQLPLGEMSLDVLSLEDALAVVDRIRPGTLVLTVREDRHWIPLWTTHLGFVLSDTEEPTVRHATRMSSKVVRDHGLKWYLEHVATYSNWPTAGIALLEPVEQGPRLSALEQ